MYIVRSLAIFLSILVVGYVVIANTVPFDISRTFKSNGKDILVLGPSSRVQTSEGITIQADDLVYTTNKMHFNFNKAKVNVIFNNPSNSQELLIGYKDQANYHYNSQILDAPFIDKLDWTKIGTGPYLYQKIPVYKSANDFIKNLPKDKNIGLYDYAAGNITHADLILPEYKPAIFDTVFNVPLRGKSTLYTYLNNEPFKMSFTKQDLNWYPDPDIMKISVYKGSDKVFDATIDDYGNATNNHNLGQKQTVEIKNPGPGLPEAGVYKVVINGGDSVLTNITTNLHKLVFEGPLYPVSNALIYPGLVAKTNPSDFYTNATILTVQTFHTQALQTLKAGTQSFKIPKVSMDVPIKLNATSAPAKLTAPQSDIILNGLGYFAFRPDEFFTPNPYKILPINNAADLSHVDYVLTNYQAPIEQNGWLVAERQFDISDSVIQKGSLSWLISAPGLKDSKNTVEYKQIQITLSKKGWFRH